MNNNHLQNGFTLLDLIVGIVFLTVAFVGSLIAMSNIQSQSDEMEALTRASSMANSVMEVMRAQQFDENPIAPWTSSLGPEEGSPALYEDVDDFIGFTWTYEGYYNYTAVTRVFYVNPAVNLMDSVGIVTDYKRIIVSVNHPELDSPVHLSSLRIP